MTDDLLGDETRRERDKYRDHSILLNRVTWTLLEATGMVGPDDRAYESEDDEVTLTLVTQVIAERDALAAGVAALEAQIVAANERAFEAGIQSIVARNPGINEDEVRAIARKAAAAPSTPAPTEETNRG